MISRFTVLFFRAKIVQFSIPAGMTGAAGWILWCMTQRRKRRYVWKCFLFIVLATSSLLLEVNDFPPIFWTLDAHAIWHLVTAPLTVLFYRWNSFKFSLISAH